MALTDLSEPERNTVKQCLRAAAEGPFFPEWEFPTLFGISRQELSAIYNSWETIDERDENTVLAINNSMANLLCYPHDEENQWAEFISATPEEVERIFYKWRGEEVKHIIDMWR
jgi:hypothetical protein